MYNSYVDKRKE